PVVELCKQLGVSYYRGSEADVLSRYFYAAREYNAEVVVRITADCPLIDPQVVDQVIAFYLRHVDSCDYVSNVSQRTYPRGMDTEVFTLSMLEEAHINALEISEREHVTPYIRKAASKRLANIAYHENQSGHRWTVDQEEDFQLIEKILQNLYPVNPLFTMEDVLELLNKHPDWLKINAKVEQKIK
ncbi:MAG: glycosyltransferase family protein, partial [Syntrophomonadaceae bacterium]|nr:glycosyltransferase family protein [Syntrophomonadaceae bacterium]